MIDYGQILVILVKLLHVSLVRLTGLAPHEVMFSFLFAEVVLMTYVILVILRTAFHDLTDVKDRHIDPWLRRVS